MNLLFAEPEALPTPTAGEVIAALDLARVIVKAGWVQRQAFAIVNGQPCYCTAAAITAASRTKQIRDAALRAARMALPGRFQGRSIETFNDDKATHVGDVAWLLVGAKSLVGQVVAA